MFIDDFHNLERKKRMKVWKPFMEKYDCQRVCELGVRKGYNFMRMIAHEPKEAVAVDLWREIGIPSVNDGMYPQEELNRQYEKFKKMTADKPFVKIHRDFTDSVASLYPDEYFDLVFIDADHSFEGVMRDIKAWYPKVKKGKFLFGHDFRVRETKAVKFGVMKAVTRFCHDNGLWFFVDGLTIWGIRK